MVEFFPIDKNDFSITGSGNSVGVFSTVVDIITAFVVEYDPSNIYISAKEINRVKLYLKMIKRLLPGWHITIEDTYIIVQKSLY